MYMKTQQQNRLKKGGRADVPLFKTNVGTQSKNELDH